MLIFEKVDKTLLVVFKKHEVASFVDSECCGGETTASSVYGAGPGDQVVKVLHKQTGKEVQLR